MDARARTTNDKRPNDDKTAMTASQQPSVYTSVIITLVPAILAVVLRFYPARLRKVSLWWDDHLAVFALVRRRLAPSALLPTALPTNTMPLMVGW